MKKLKTTSALLTCAILLGLAVTAQATSLYWDSDGNTNAGLGVAGTFDWLTNTPWTTDPSGTSGTITNWYSSANVAVFNGNGAATSTVSSNVICAGFNIVNSPGSAINATVNLSGAGSVTSTAAIYIGDYYGASPGCTATLNLSNTLEFAGTSYSGAVVYIGGTGCSGTANLLGTNAYLGGYGVDIGNNGSNGTANVSGGTLYSYGNPYISRSGNGTLNVSGTGLVEFNNTIICATTNYSGTINLNGGRMVLGAISRGTTNANNLAIINFNGGVLAGSKSANPWLPGTLDQLNVLSGGAIIDSVTYGVYISAPLVTGVGGGPDGGLTKLSAGSLILYGTNTYTGPTLVSAGTLELYDPSPATVTSTISNSDLITVSPGAILYVYYVGSDSFVLGSGQTLSGGGVVEGSVSVANSSTAIIHPGGGGTNATTLKVGNPSGAIKFLGSSAQAIFDLSSTYNGANDEVTLSNDTLTCGSVQIGINCGSVLDTQDYTLFDVGASGTISGSFNATPVWVGTVPIHASQYSIIKSGTEYVKLHYTPIPVTITGVTAANKVYDSTTSATFSSSGTVSGLTSPDTTNTVTVVPGTGVFSSSSVGTWGVTASGFTLAGADAGFYSLQSQPTGLTATITAATLTVTGASVTPHVYDGTENATITGATLSGVLAGDVGNVTLGNDTTGTFAQVTVGTGISVATAPMTISGSASGNYSLTQPTLTGNITAATLTVTGASVTPHVYDGTENATITGATLSGVIAGDVGNVTLGNDTTGTFAQATVGTGISVATAPMTISGSASGNYSLTQPTLTGNITPANTSFGLTSSTNPCGYNTSVSFTASSLPSDATGSVAFLTNGVSFDTENVSSGSATSVATATLLPGTNLITAEYSGDGNYFPSTNTLSQIVTEPLATPMTAQRVAGTQLLIALSDLATNWSDAVSGVTVEMTNVNLLTTNNVTLMLLNVTTNPDGSYFITNDAYIGYTNSLNVNDQFSYSLIDQYGATNTGIVNIVVVTNVTGTSSITSIVSGNPTTLTAYGIPGYMYITQRSTNLVSPVWVNIATNTAATNGVISVSDDFSDLGNQEPANAYYRLSWSPSP